MSTSLLPGPVADVVAGLGTVLGVWAHPDDEAYLSGGVMAAAVDAGSRVVCVTATRGERGTPAPEAWPPERLAPVREAELSASLMVLGVTEHLQLGYPDGGCAEVSVRQAVGRLAELIADVRPQTVLTFGPDGMTGHADHRTVSAWATTAVARTPAAWRPRLLYAAKIAGWSERFESLNRLLGISPAGLPPRVASADVAFDLVLPDDLVNRKVAALAAQSSQVAPLMEVVGEDVFRSWVANECFRPAAQVAGPASHLAATPNGRWRDLTLRPGQRTPCSARRTRPRGCGAPKPCESGRPPRPPRSRSAA